MGKITKIMPANIKLISLKICRGGITFQKGPETTSEEEFFSVPVSVLM